jgi:hypothetical protein
VLASCDSDRKPSSDNRQVIQVKDPVGFELSIEQFQGFEIRNKSNFTSYSIPPKGTYEYGLIDFYGVLIENKEGKNVIRPILANQKLPAASEVYSDVFGGNSLGMILDENNYNNYNSTQLYSLVATWCQAVMLLDEFKNNELIFALSKEHMNKIRELESISGMERFCEKCVEIDEMSDDNRRLEKAKALAKSFLLDLQ